MPLVNFIFFEISCGTVRNIVASHTCTVTKHAAICLNKNFYYAQLRVAVNWCDATTAAIVVAVGNHIIF
jgi:hypothetical protein